MSVIRVLDHIAAREAHVQHDENRARLRAAKARSLAATVDDSLARIGSRARRGDGNSSRPRSGVVSAEASDAVPASDAVRRGEAAEIARIAALDAGPAVEPAAASGRTVHAAVPGPGGPAISAEEVIAALDRLPDGLLLLDDDGTLRFANRAWRAVANARGPESARLDRPRANYFDMLMGLELTADSSDLAQAFGGELQDVFHGVRDACRCQLGYRVGCEHRYELIRGCRLPHGGAIVTHVDVTDLVERHQELEVLAHRDALTGLFNRRALRVEGEHLLQDARSGGAAAQVLVLDVDDFKAINDRCGHSVGDAVLVELARRLVGVLRDGDAVARIGGDEFGIVARDPDDGSGLLERLRGALARPIRVENELLEIVPSLGAAQFPVDGASLDALLMEADTRMYRDKELRRAGREPPGREEAPT